MIEPSKFVARLKAEGAALFTGVPDSLLASLCAYVDDHLPPSEQIITANEGNAVALAMGHHLSTGQFSVVYLQNSGLGNTINPLTSLADAEVYRIPMLLIVGWRGRPGTHDEPQHVKQGRITEAQLALLDIPTWTVDAETDADAVIAAACASLRERGAPAALLVKAGSFIPYTPAKSSGLAVPMTREAALEQVLMLAAPDDLLVITTGKASREVYELRKKLGQPQNDFLTVGGMGHTASIALGVALGQPRKRVLCIDGDGSVLMHLGALPVIASVKPANLVHVLINNAAHESVGGQPTVADRVDFEGLAMACGYAAYRQAETVGSISAAFNELRTLAGPVLVEIRVRNGARADLGRPTSTPAQNKAAFMRHAHD
jgi:phosphonopyruvate decarboxylase